MNTKKKIEKHLHAAPNPQTPDGLLNKLQQDVAATNIKTRRSALYRWFVPDNRTVSLRRIAYAAAIAMVVMLPLSYGAAKIIKRFSTFKHTFQYPNNTTYSIGNTLSGDNIQSKEDAEKVLKEFGDLYRQGKAKEIKPGLWQVTLSNGEKFAHGGRHPELAGLMNTKEAKEILKQEFDEIEELRKAGKFEKTYKPEHDFEVDGVKYRYFEAHYVLSSGEAITIGSSEPAED